MGPAPFFDLLELPLAVGVRRLAVFDPLDAFGRLALAFEPLALVAFEPLALVAFEPFAFAAFEPPVLALAREALALFEPPAAAFDRLDELFAFGPEPLDV